MVSINDFRMPLEDTVDYVIAKAQKGLGLTNRALAEKAGTDRAGILEAGKGRGSDALYNRLAEVLGLDPGALREIARSTYHPALASAPQGLFQITTAYKDFSVNAYLVRDPKSREAAVFDTGTNASALLDLISNENLQLTAIYLTHTHRDHVMDLDKLRNRSGAPVYTGWEEPWPNARAFREGKSFSVGSLSVQTLSTKGHARGGITYLVEGFPEGPVAIVGDAVFAGSIGGPLVSYDLARQTIIQNILPLPPETVLAPGHGPLTTLPKEKSHNPFLAAWA